MHCPDCQNTGYLTTIVPVFVDGAYQPDYIEVRCACNPAPTDDDVPHWADDEPLGTAYEDFHPIRDAAVVGV